MGIELVMSVLAFGIASGTLMYNVHEFRHISKETREGNERLAKLMDESRRESRKDRMEFLKELKEIHKESRKDRIAIVEALKRR